jgi:hypothetical protein
VTPRSAFFSGCDADADIVRIASPRELPALPRIEGPELVAMESHVPSRGPESPGKPRSRCESTSRALAGTPRESGDGPSLGAVFTPNFLAPREDSHETP